MKTIDADNHILFRGTSLLRPNKGMPHGIITRKPHDELCWREKTMLIGREVG